ncbi:recombinase family protein [Chitinilyticum aquatile]|uniref:recombinase family protein n=1 Tax=Chitinilyticum aquatile TaxID=362520 RepID=UPI00048EFC63|nr:recombinase family protein [Chitinilyticum aquatile]
MTTIAYLRVSTDDQTTENQRQQIAARYSISKWFRDEAISGTVRASERPALKECLGYLREGDTLVVAAIDRLGRNTVDVLHTVEAIQAKGASVVSMREGFDLGTPIGKALLTMLAAVAELELSNLKARQMAGIERAKAAGKAMGRPAKVDAAELVTWKQENKASIKQTAVQFGVSEATVKRVCAAAKAG